MQRVWNGKAKSMPMNPDSLEPSQYTGIIKDGVRCDPKGTEVFLHTGDVYIGNFENGEATGWGKMKYKIGGEFIGDFKSWAPWRGKATDLPLPSTDKYTGAWDKGAPNGKGSLKHRDGRGVFEGMFLDGKQVSGAMKPMPGTDPRLLQPLTTPGIGMRRRRESPVPTMMTPMRNTFVLRGTLPFHEAPGLRIME